MRHPLAYLPPLLALLAVVLSAIAAYWPGLRGTFLFDDFGNLPALGASGPIDHWPTFWRYITSGTADPTGRPLTMLTFLIDAHNWPADPYPFKRTNLILHMFNGVLLYFLLVKLGRTLTLEAPRYQIAALLGTAMWLLHPLLVSTTLYIVQREAMLPATCTLAGLLIWLHGRAQLLDRKVTTGSVWSIIGLGGFTLLGVLAKANGILLPLYVLLLEIVLFAPRQTAISGSTRHAHRSILMVFSVVPACAIGSYLLWIGIHGVIAGGPALRPWTYAQRLLTEPRVLMDYLQLLWLPRSFSNGLFNDQYAVSTSFLHPATTLPAIIAVMLLIGGAWHSRQRHPALALSILFYFAGQLVESSSIPLELYFEHRNYVPAMLMFWPLGLWLADARSLKFIKRFLLIALPMGLASLTHARADLWGNVREQALIWAQINPDSPRAQANAAQIEMQNGHPREAISRLEKLLAAQPDQAQLAFNLIGARCMTGGNSPADLNAARAAMHGTASVGALLAHWFDLTLPVVMAGGCPGLTLDGLQSLIDAGLQNPRLDEAGPQQDLTYLRGRIALAQHRPDVALTDFTQALDLQVRPGMALEAAATLGAAGYPTQGLRMLDHYQKKQKDETPPGLGMPLIHQWVLARQNYWPHEFAHLRQQLSLDATALNTNTLRSTLDPSTSH